MSEGQISSPLNPASRHPRRPARAVLALVAGAAMALALPPFALTPLVFLAFPAFLLLLDTAKTRKNAFAVGFWFGFGHFLLLLHWIVLALFTDVDKYAALMPVALFGPALALAPLTGLAGLATFLLSPKGSARRAICLTAAWSLAEWLRGHILTGFPWMPVGHVWDPVLPMWQTASLWGVYGLGLFTLLLASTPYILIQNPARTKTAACAAATLLLAMGWGSWRLYAHPTTFMEGVRLRIVQPGISQDEKADPTRMADTFHTHLAFSTAPAPERPNLIVWPETAVVFPLDEDAAAREMIAHALPAGGLLLAGTIHRTPQDNAPSLYYNGMTAIDHAGRVVGGYDKAHLVPFGEYMPLRGLLPLDAIAASDIDFSEGPGPRTLPLPGMPSVSPLICFEAIFPHAVTDQNARPDALLALTNDGWFGHSAGPHQHFAMARMRAVEEGLPLVRAANTGISGITDGLGRVITSLNLGQTGFLDGNLPKPMVAKTAYARFGDFPFLAVLLGIFFYLVAKQHK